MNSPHDLLDNNRHWSARIKAKQPTFFTDLARQQTPVYLWIGCADSRIPASQIVDLPPGGLFVHRNVANVVIHSDLNMLATVQFAVDVLKVRHILLVGHYGCGGVGRALEYSEPGKQPESGLIDTWLHPVGEIALRHASRLDPSINFATRHARLCELNTIEQAVNICRIIAVRQAWDRQQALTVHAWIYGLEDGHLHDLDLEVRHHAQLSDTYEHALKKLTARWNSITSYD